MNTSPHAADHVWEKTLSHLRSTKRSRQTRRRAAALSLLTLTTISLIHSWSPSFHPLYAKPNSTPTSIRIPPPPTVAILRLDWNGNSRLEELALDQLESFELAFNLTQTVPPNITDSQELIVTTLQ